jgi:hypothetical protein
VLSEFPTIVRGEHALRVTKSSDASESMYYRPTRSSTACKLSTFFSYVRATISNFGLAEPWQGFHTASFVFYADGGWEDRRCFGWAGGEWPPRACFGSQPRSLVSVIHATPAPIVLRNCSRVDLVLKVFFLPRSSCPHLVVEGLA